ncbi:MAG: hypothetical protein A2041_08445 [Bacteroidetes bacterium GWA2_31_9b]|nr:MAG: hypothetical protein A2041_08445 [Bacteroidetes bacterium GWA2_31_9b]
MTILLIITAICLILSLIADKNKTWKGIKKGMKMFLNLLPVILAVIIMISVVLFFLPNETIVKYLGKGDGFMGYIIASIMGSIALIHGFIAYPLAGILVKN